MNQISVHVVEKNAREPGSSLPVNGVGNTAVAIVDIDIKNCIWPTGDLIEYAWRYFFQDCGINVAINPILDQAEKERSMT